MKERLTIRKGIAAAVMAGVGAASLAGVTGCGEVTGQSAPAKAPRVANYIITGSTSERQPDGKYKESLTLSACLPFSDQGVSGNKKSVGAGIYYGNSARPDGLITLGTGYVAQPNGVNLTGAAKVTESGSKVEKDNQLYGGSLANLASRQDIGASQYNAKVTPTFGVACSREVVISDGVADYRMFDPSKGLNGEATTPQPTNPSVDPFYGGAIVNVSQEQNGRELITVVGEPHDNY